MRKADHESLTGRTIAGKFVIEALIGSGAMGAVFRARQVALEKAVAIKVLHGEHAADPAFAARFHREAKAASRLNHPNSIQIIDFGAEPDGLLYIAMELIDGRSLHHVVREDWPMAPARVADIVMQTLAALAVAHDLGVVHRDLKPENVMVLAGTDDDGRAKDIVKVCDFGIAKITDPRAYRAAGERESEAPVTTAGFLVGTPEYMSPEQGRGEKLDPRSDLYSVGVILYEMLTKRVPFDAENAIGVVLKHITEEPTPPSRVVSGVDPRLEAVALRALRKFREERHGNAREMRADLRPVTEGAFAGLTPETPVPAVATEEMVNAATVAMPVPVVPYGLAPKPTLQGTTTASIPRPVRKGRGLMLAGVIVVALATGAIGTATWVRAHAHPEARAYAPVVVPPMASMVPIAPSLPGGVKREAADGEGAAPVNAASARLVAPMVAPGRAKAGLPLASATAPVAGASGKAANAGTAPSAAVVAAPASASPGVLVLPTAEPSVGSTTPGISANAAPSPLPIASAAPGEAARAADPDFDPERAYVEIGMINAEGVPENAIRSALHGAPLSQCYKTSLRTRGGRSTGVGTLNLSFDENGSARSAVLTGAEFLPGLARCVQEATSGVHLGKDHVDPGGGVAEVTLGFREP
jgi:serine/threonine-protein kinase